jgi:soluble lytic murein transglycosylase
LPATAAEEDVAPFSPLAAAEIEEIETWLETRHGPRNPLAPSVLDHGAAVLGLALVEAGEPAVGRTLLFQVASEHAQQPYALLDLGVEAERRALYDVSMSIGNRLLIPVTAHARLDAPRALLRLAYPAPFAEEVTAAVEGTSLPPLLLLAVIRQESQFNPDATSPVGAVGLGQVMPGTGEEIARQLGEVWDPANLRDPATSLRYGAHYLAAQLEAFDGDILATLGAYNAGPGSAARWLDNQPFEGPDGFLHGIDFTQTRTYLEHVLENYAWYRYLYADIPAPALP